MQKLITIAIVATMFAACTNNQSSANKTEVTDTMATADHHHEGDAEEGHHQQHDDNAAITTLESPAPATESASVSNAKPVAFPLATVYSAYFKLKNALSNDDGKKAQDAAKELFENIAKIDVGTMTAEQSGVWAKYKGKLSFDAEHIKGVDENEHQREHFVSLSKNMSVVMKGIKNDKPVYYQNCPMYDNGKGANWLSLESSISNPYLGKSMPTCGKQIETIK